MVTSYVEAWKKFEPYAFTFHVGFLWYLIMFSPVLSRTGTMSDKITAENAGTE